MSKVGGLFKGNFSYHLVVWVLLILPTVFGSPYIFKAGIGLYFINLLVRNGVVLTIVYLNYLYFIPKFFRQKRFVLFAILTIGLVGLSMSANMTWDRYISFKLNYGSLTTEQLMLELVFYAFNIASYILTSFLLYSLHEKQEQKETLDQVQVEKFGAEIKYLRAQINPHFLFNTLNNLYGLALEKSEKTPEIIMKLSKIMDYMLYESTDVKVYLKKDIENIGNYIDIERIRQGNNARIVFETTGDVGDLKIVPLTLLPLVENAFKHGVNTIINGAYMDVNITIHGSHLEMDVKNNFRIPADNVERSGIGLVNLKRRLDLFYPSSHAMTVNTTSDDYHVNLKLTLA